MVILENEGDFEAATALTIGYANLLQRRDEPDYQPVIRPFLNRSHASACEALGVAMAAARAARPTTREEFKRLRETFGNWWMVADQTDVEHVGCVGISSEQIADGSIDLLTREKVFLDQKFKGSARAIDFSEPSEAVKQARRHKAEVEALDTIVGTLGLPDLNEAAPLAIGQRKRSLALAASGMAPLIQTHVIDPLVAPARESAWALRKGGGGGQAEDQGKAHETLHCGAVIRSFPSVSIGKSGARCRRGCAAG